MNKTENNLCFHLVALITQGEELFQVTLTPVSLTACGYIQGQKRTKSKIIKCSIVILLLGAVLVMLPENAVWVMWNKAGEQFKCDHLFFFF